MNKTERTYYNRCALVSANLTTSKSQEHKLLKLKFVTPKLDPKWVTLFLNEKNNDRNRETLQTLGVEAPPEYVTYDELSRTELAGLGSRVVDLVAESDGEYENVKFINPAKFPVKIYPESDF